MSISAGNSAKTIPSSVLAKLIHSIEDLSCTFFVFGISTKQPLFNELLKLIRTQDNVINLIGQLKLEDVPWVISQMNFYISSDSGNAYIADSQGIPVIIFYGPCSIQEQCPIQNVLLIVPENIQASSFVFDAGLQFEQSAEILFGLDEKISKIKFFIKKLR